jgi:replicative DNA helicase
MNKENQEANSKHENQYIKYQKWDKSNGFTSEYRADDSDITFIHGVVNSEDFKANISGVDGLIERGLISDLLIDSSLYNYIAGIVEAKMFQQVVHKVLFAVVHKLWSENKMFDVYNILPQARVYFQNIVNHKKYNALEKAEAEYYLNEEALDELTMKLLDRINMPTEEEVKEKANAIREGWMAKQLLKKFSQTLLGIRKKRNIYSVLEHLKTTIENLTTVPGDDNTTIKQLAPAFLQAVNERIENKHISNKFKSGFTGIDQLAPLKKTHLRVIGARPAMGKTALMLIYALAVAKTGAPVRIYSLEMSQFELIARWCQYLIGISSERILDGEITKDEFALVQTVAAALEILDIKIDDDTFSIEEMVRQLRYEQFTDGVVIADFIQMAKTEQRITDRADKVTHIVIESKIAAKRHNSCWIWLSQLTKEVESRKDKRPFASDLLYGSGLEQTANVIEVLFREEYYLGSDAILKRPDLVDKGEVIVRKHRGGSVGTVDLDFVTGCWESDYLNDLYGFDFKNTSAVQQGFQDMIQELGESGMPVDDLPF